MPSRRGRYEIHDAFAAGATSTVHLARVAGTERVVAVKRLHPHLATDELRAMLASEAKVVARIAHPNVVQVVEAIDEGGETLLVMEYVEGETLERLLGGAAPPPPAIAVAVVRDVLSGLHAAHHARDENGAPLALVHRDVSPKNVLVDRDGHAKILDFGIARVRGRARTTRDGHVRGTLAYMAPEQLTGGALSSAADIYGAGVVLWEALTGRLLFDGESEGAITRQILDHDFAAPSTIRPGLPRALDAVVMRAVARSPDARFATALEMALALETALAPAPAEDVARWVEERAGETIAARRRALDAPIAIADDEPPPRAAPSSRRAGRPAWAVPLAVLVTASSVAAAFTAARRRHDDAVGAQPVDAAPAQAAAPPEAPVASSAEESASSPPVVTSAVAPARATPRRPPPAAPVVAPVVASAPPSAASSAPSPTCSPYWIDSAGRRRFNRECLR